MDGKRVICIFVVWGIFLTALSTADNASWQVSKVQSGVSSFGGWLDIEKTPGTNQFGIVNCARQSGSYNLYYHQGNASSWTTTLVDSFGPFDDKKFGFAYNPVTGKPSISYQKGDSLYLASLNGNSWSNQMVASNAKYGSSLAFNQAGEAIIAYCSSGSLKCAYQQGGSWQNRTIQNSLFHYQDPSMKISFTEGTASIAYSDSRETVYYAQSTNLADWSVSQVYSTQGIFPKSTRLEFDPTTGNPVVAFKENLFGPLDVCRNDGGAWQAPVTAVGGDNVTNSFGFALTPDGRAAIVYVDKLTSNSNGVQILLENSDGSFSAFDRYLFNSVFQFDGPADLLWDNSGAYIAYKSWSEGIYFAHVVPEPATILLLTLGSLALRRRTK